MKIIYRTLLALALAGSGFAAQPIETLTDPQKAATRTALSLGTAATADKSSTGGIGKIIELNSAGNLQIQAGTISGDGLAGGPGNMNLQNGSRLWMLNATNTSGGSVFYNATHGADGGEVQFNSDHRIALCMGWYGALQIGLATDASTNKQYAYMQSRGPATASITSTDSLPLYFQPLRWNGSSSVVTQSPSIQGVADGTTGDAFLDFSAVGAQPNGYGADGTRTLNMRLSKNGVWEAGKAPAFDTLTAASNVFTQTCSIYKTIQAAKITLGATNSLVISGAVAGMRGVIYVTQDGTGSRTLTLPENSGKDSAWALSTSPVFTDRLSWEFDGVYFLWSISKGIEFAIEADAQDFITRQGTVDTVEKFAINNLVRGLKSGTLWGKTVAAYPFIGATGAAQGENLKSNTFDMTWAGSGHTFASATGVTGSVAGSAYGNTGINLSSLSRTNNVSAYAYQREAAPTTGGGYFFGCTDANGRFGIARSTTYMSIQGPNNQGNGDVATVAAFANSFALTRSASNATTIGLGTTEITGTAASTAAPNNNLYVLARNNTGTAGGFSNANLAFFWLGDALTTTEMSELRGYVTAYQATLGRANP